MARVPALPQNTGLTYLAEGAANIVYRINIRLRTPKPRTPEPSVLEQYGPETPPPTDIEPEDELEYKRRRTSGEFDPSSLDDTGEDSSHQTIFEGKSRHVTLHIQPYICTPHMAKTFTNSIYSQTSPCSQGPSNYVTSCHCAGKVGETRLPFVLPKSGRRAVSRGSPIRQHHRNTEPRASGI
jgi:hypothetical protein